MSEQIRVDESVKQELELLKEHESESIGSVVDRLLKAFRDDPKYDDEFKDFVKYVIREHFEVEEIHVTECASGLQVLWQWPSHIQHHWSVPQVRHLPAASLQHHTFPLARA